MSTPTDDPCTTCVKAVQLRTDRANLFVRVDTLKEEKEKAEDERDEWRAYAKRLQAAGSIMYGYSRRSQMCKRAMADWRKLQATAPDCVQAEVDDK